MPVFFFHFIACFHKAPALVNLYFCWYLSAEKTKINTKISLLAIRIENIVLCYVRWLRYLSTGGNGIHSRSGFIKAGEHMTGQIQ